MTSTVPTEHVLTPDDRCPCGQPQTGSGYCSYECYSKHEPSSTVPASMGGPLSEAEEAAARIRAYLDACPDAESFGRETRWELRDANGNPYDLPRADLAAVLDALGVLEGQLATARALHQPLIVDWSTSPKCKASHGVAWVNWPCPDAVALGLDGGGSDAE